jgi:Cd(II)/Pb(II)-responsive transcriptional regulator
MKIGELARVSGCSIQTIRYYEKEQLLDSPRRSEGNFRLYDQVTYDQLMFIKHCRSLDITLAEIRQLIDLKQTPNSQCEDVNKVVYAHILHVGKRIEELQSLRKQLKTLRRKCHSNQIVKDCGILQDLSGKQTK